jgi:hypothetical protein
MTNHIQQRRPENLCRPYLTGPWARAGAAGHQGRPTFLKLKQSDTRRRFLIGLPPPHTCPTDARALAGKIIGVHLRGLPVIAERGGHVGDGAGDPAEPGGWGDGQQHFGDLVFGCRLPAPGWCSIPGRPQVTRSLPAPHLYQRCGPGIQQPAGRPGRVADSSLVLSDVPLAWHASCSGCRAEEHSDWSTRSLAGASYSGLALSLGRIETWQI